MAFMNINTLLTKNYTGASTHANEKLLFDSDALFYVQSAVELIVRAVQIIAGKITDCDPKRLTIERTRRDGRWFACATLRISPAFRKRIVHKNAGSY